MARARVRDAEQGFGQCASGSAEPKNLNELMHALRDEDSAVRYWGATGLLMRKQIGVGIARDLLHQALQDESPYVRIAAAEALGRYGDKIDVGKAVPVLLELAAADKNGIYASMYALNALDYLDGNAAGVPGVTLSIGRR